MKKRSLVLLVVFALVGLFVIACVGPGQEVVKKVKMSVVVTTPMVEISKTAKVIIYGMGFTPKQEVLFLFKDADGVQNVIMTDALKPVPVPNEEGAWVTQWDCSPYISLLKAGTLVISVTDNEYKTLAQVPVEFVAPPPPKKAEPKKDEKKDDKKAEPKKEEKKK
jgi:hypothetical protein